jgi:hypothetical protein
MNARKFTWRFSSEVAGIMLGISLTLGAERMASAWQDRQAGIAALRRIALELQRDSSDLAYNIRIHRLTKVSIDAISAWSRGSRALSDDSVAYYAAGTLGGTYFASNTAEFEALRGAGKLDLIWDDALPNRLVRHYNRYGDFALLIDFVRMPNEALWSHYRTRTRFTTVDFSASGDYPDLIHFEPGSLRGLRGDATLHNLLQHKRSVDGYILARYEGALKSVHTLRQQILQMIDDPETGEPLEPVAAKDAARG